MPLTMRFPFLAPLLLALCLFCGPQARAETPAQVEDPLRARRSWVSDGAGVIDTQTERNINAVLNRLEAKNGAEIAVVTVHNLGGRSVETFANALFRRWKIGKKGRDNGVLILAAIDERRKLNQATENYNRVAGSFPLGLAGKVLGYPASYPYFEASQSARDTPRF